MDSSWIPLKASLDEYLLDKLQHRCCSNWNGVAIVAQWWTEYLALFTLFTSDPLLLILTTNFSMIFIWDYTKVVVQVIWRSQGLNIWHALGSTYAAVWPYFKAWATCRIILVSASEWLHGSSAVRLISLLLSTVSWQAVKSKVKANIHVRSWQLIANEYEQVFLAFFILVKITISFMA